MFFAGLFNKDRDNGSIPASVKWKQKRQLAMTKGHIFQQN